MEFQKNIKYINAITCVYQEERVAPTYMLQCVEWLRLKTHDDRKSLFVIERTLRKLKEESRYNKTSLIRPRESKYEKEMSIVHANDPRKLSNEERENPIMYMETMLEYDIIGMDIQDKKHDMQQSINNVAVDIYSLFVNTYKQGLIDGLQKKMATENALIYTHKKMIALKWSAYIHYNMQICSELDEEQFNEVYAHIIYRLECIWFDMVEGEYCIQPARQILRKNYKDVQLSIPAKSPIYT